MRYSVLTLLPALLIGFCGGAPDSGSQPSTTSRADHAIDSKSVASPKIPATPSPAPAEPVPLRNLLGHVDPAKDSAFAVIPKSFTARTDVLYMNTEALEAYTRMRAAALKDGVTLTIRSSFRSFSYQKRIWNGKWNGTTLVKGKDNLRLLFPDPKARALEILKYSSMPGTSRHHWGTDVDLNDLNDSYFASGAGYEIHNWLTAHAGKYGFCQVYSAKDATRIEGYNKERWHWSYLPVAKRYLAAYPATVRYEHLKGFEGWEMARQIGVIEKYVGGINPACKWESKE